MKNASRITSVVNATHLDASLTGIPTFHLSELQLTTLPEIELPNNRRLGHLIEKVISELIKASENFQVLHENVQIVKDKNTIGELDFIIQHINTHEIIHLELAYKFYVYDPTLSSKTIECWIGPNRRDALHEKLEKLQQKQFPLLYHEVTQTKLPNIPIETITQKLCVLAYLYIPYDAKVELPDDYQKAVKGYYMDFKTFESLEHSEKSYYIPYKKEWGIDPAENKHWSEFDVIKATISKNLAEKRSLLCWQKQHDTFETFFIVWW